MAASPFSKLSVIRRQNPRLWEIQGPEQFDPQQHADRVDALARRYVARAALCTPPDPELMALAAGARELAADIRTGRFSCSFGRVIGQPAELFHSSHYRMVRTMAGVTR